MGQKQFIDTKDDLPMVIDDKNASQMESKELMVPKESDLDKNTKPTPNRQIFMGSLTETTDITHFLRSTCPPMNHLLAHFVDFGCTNYFFRPVITHWNGLQISQFLDRVSESKGPDQTFSAMERMIIERHLSLYIQASAKT